MRDAGRGFGIGLGFFPGLLVGCLVTGVLTCLASGVLFRSMFGAWATPQAVAPNVTATVTAWHIHPGSARFRPVLVCDVTLKNNGPSRLRLGQRFEFVMSNGETVPASAVTAFPFSECRQCRVAAPFGEVEAGGWVTTQLQAMVEPGATLVRIVPG